MENALVIWNTTILVIGDAMETATKDLERDLGAALRARRLAAGRTQVELSREANISLNAVRSLEAGAGSSVATLVRVVHALSADAWLSDLTPRPAPFNPLTLLDEPRPRGPRRVRRKK